MMRVLVTGAGGFVGQALALALLRGAPGDAALDRLMLVDTDLPALPDEVRASPAATCLTGSVGDATVLEQIFHTPPDVIFHLAGLTSRAAQDDWARGLVVNVQASMALLQALETQHNKQAPPPRWVFASSIAVFGAPLPPTITDDTAPEPALSYGCQKRMVELLVADGTRRGFVNGCSLRLPAVIARPLHLDHTQALSAFSSQILRVLAAGQPYACPVSPTATHWLLSLPCAVAQLLHAARMLGEERTPSLWPASRALILPALRVRTEEMVWALEQHFSRPLAHLVQWQPDVAQNAALDTGFEAQFARWPALTTAAADRLGFVHDGNVATLVARALGLAE